MNDKEGVIEELEVVRNAIVDGYIHEPDRAVNAVADAIELLKAQEAVKPILKREGWNKHHNNYSCPVCDEELVFEQNYCSECGRAVKWDE